MQLGFVLFKMVSGDIQTALGYRSFFLWVLVSAVPVLLLSWFMHIPAQASSASAATGEPAQA